MKHPIHFKMMRLTEKGWVNCPWGSDGAVLFELDVPTLKWKASSIDRISPETIGPLWFTRPSAFNAKPADAEDWQIGNLPCCEAFWNPDTEVLPLE